MTRPVPTYMVGGIGLLITVSVIRSSSSAWMRALALLEAEPTHALTKTPAGTAHTVTFGEADIDRYQALMDIAGGWKGTSVAIDGTSVDADGIGRLIDCYRGCCGAGDRCGYCRGSEVTATAIGPVQQLFPCRLVPISESNYLGWFLYGRMAGDYVYMVDKARLREKVYQYLRRHLAIHCPAFDREAVDRTIADLPEKIDPRKDRNWVYRHGWVNGRYRVVGVEKRQQGQGGGGRAAGEPDAPDAAAIRLGELGQGGPASAVHERDIPAVRYADIGGIDAQIKRLRETVELPLRYPELFEHLGITPHRGLLLYGPPGTGKTMLAKALANEAKAHFIFVNGPEIISKFHGESEQNLRNLFAEAKQMAPSVILFDEIDSIAPDRATVSQNFEAVLVSQLLSLMDGLIDRGQVVVIGTTNRPDNVDPALKRPGRLDFQMEIGLPDEQGRLAILRIHGGRMPLTAGVDLEVIATRTPNFAGADIAALCREAGLECVRDLIDITSLTAELDPTAVAGLTVRPEHFERALAKVVPTVQRHQRLEARLRVLADHA